MRARNGSYSMGPERDNAGAGGGARRVKLVVFEVFGRVK
jgi:hypothetical protein